MRFLADMGVAIRVVDWLRAEGHDAVHLREQGLQRMPDKEIFQKAATEERIVLTFDLDFGEIVALSPKKPASVILFRLRNTHTPHVVDRLRVALAESKEALEAGAVIIVEEARLRPDGFRSSSRNESWSPGIKSSLRARKCGKVVTKSCGLTGHACHDIASAKAGR
jgi:predicted nuclease of predicted toxin-antitoxin system